MAKMVEVEEALDVLLRSAAHLRTATYRVQAERVALPEADGRVLAADVHAPFPVPAYDYSAMDGYAYFERDAEAEQRLPLLVVGECQTGHEGVNPGLGEAVRIFTGARVPPACNVVVMQENTERHGEHVHVLQRPKLGANIRRRGEDLQEGELALPKGMRLNPFRLSLLATLEQTQASVSLRPRVAILCSGDELRAPGMTFQGGLAESNSVALASLVRRAGGEVQVLPFLRDDLQATTHALKTASESFDLVVTVGGVSVGDHDLIRPAMLALGGEYLFEKVRMKPGKPVMAARLGKALLLGLPGNPSSAQVTFALFGVPLMRALAGDAELRPRWSKEPLAANLSNRPGRPSYYRAKLDSHGLHLFGNQASGASTAIAWGNAFAFVPEEVQELPAGHLLDVLRFEELFS